MDTSASLRPATTRATPPNFTLRIREWTASEVGQVQPDDHRVEHRQKCHYFLPKLCFRLLEERPGSVDSRQANG